MDAGARSPAAEPSVAVRGVSVFGPAGVLDLVVSDATPAHDVARAYAERGGLAAIPLLFTLAGTPVRPDRSLAESGLESGAVLVATATVARRRPSSDRAAEAGSAEGVPAAGWAWIAVATAAAGLGAWLAIRADLTEWRRAAVIACLAVAGLLGVLPWGRRAPARAVVAPAFVCAAVLAAVWAPGGEARPLVVGIAALAAAAAAALARAFVDPAPEALVVWMWAGAGLFALAAGCALVGFGAAVVWSLALVIAALATRIVPALAIDVPDQLLIDLERLAVTAWSARDRPRGRRARTLVAPHRMASAATRGSRIVTAGAFAIAAITVLSARELLSLVHTDLDRQGARWLVFLCGAVLLLAARNHRHRLAQALLWLGGLTSWALLAWVLVGEADARTRLVGGLCCALAAALLVVTAVATGRGWRSAWWGRRAEVAEALAGALAVASVCVASGLFRHLWEIASTMFRG